MDEKLLDKKIHYWEDQLLDLGKRNKMISFRETKRATLKILKPGFNELYEQIVSNEQELSFQKSIDKDSDTRVYSVLSLLEHLSVPIEVNIGDIRAEGTLNEVKKTLKHLRSKARLALNEQGTNILYLVFGFIEWRQKGGRGNDYIKSPLILVPVSLTLPSLNSQYMLKRLDDEIVVNPTLAYLFEKDYGISLPDFDSDKDTLDGFIEKMEELAEDRGWRIIRQTSIGLVSFLKISMYNDLVKNEEELKENSIIRAFAGEENSVSRPDGNLFVFDHDAEKAIDSYQVMDADSSQQDAIALSQRGISFVMQGPPGTGKSQTITNIIAQGLADGKKILFVSEKMAALDVVYRRLTDVHLDDFCLSLHSHKANKKEILDQLSNSLNLKRIRVRNEEIERLTQLDMIREQLKTYVKDIHTIIMPLEMSLYEVYGEILRLGNLPDITLSIENPDQMTKDQVNRLALMVMELERAQIVLGPKWYKNPWHDLTGPYLEVSQKRELQTRIWNCVNILNDLEICTMHDKTLADILSLNDFLLFKKMYDHARHCSIIPHNWFLRATDKERKAVDQLKDEKAKISELLTELCAKYDQGYFNLQAQDTLEKIRDAMHQSKLLFRADITENEIFADVLTHEEQLSSLLCGVEELQKTVDHWSTVYGISMPQNVDTVFMIQKIESALSEKRIIMPAFFDAEETRTFVSKIRKTLLQLDADRKKITEKYGDAALEIEITEDDVGQTAIADDFLRSFYAQEQLNAALTKMISGFNVEEIQRIEAELVSEPVRSLCDKYGVAVPNTIEQANSQIQAIGVLPGVAVLSSWKDAAARAELQSLIEQAKAHHDAYCTAIEFLSRKFKEHGLALNPDCITPELIERLEKAHIQVDNPERILKYCDNSEAYELLRQIDDHIKQWNNVGSQISELRRIHHVRPTFSDSALWDFLRSYRLEALLCDPKREWVTKGENCKVLLSKLSQLAEEINKQHASILKHCEQSAFDIDAYGMLDRFKSEYTGIFKVFNKNYKEDTKQLRMCFRQIRKKISDDEMIELLQTLKRYHESVKEYQSYNVVVQEIFGLDRYDANHDWTMEERRLRAFFKVSQYFENSADAYHFIVGNKWDGLTNLLSNQYEQYQWFKNLSAASEMFAELYQGVHTNTAQIKKQMEHVRQMRAMFCTDEAYISYMTSDSVLESLTVKMQQIQEIEAWFTAQSDTMATYTGNSYRALENPWEELTDRLDRYEYAVQTFGENSAFALASSCMGDEIAITSYVSVLRQIVALEGVLSSLQFREAVIQRVSQMQVTDILSLIKSVVCYAEQISLVYEKLFLNGKTDDTKADELIRDLTMVQQYRSAMKQLPQMELEGKEQLGVYYNGLDTDWDTLESNIEFCDNIAKLLNGAITDELKKAFMAQKPLLTEMQQRNLQQTMKQVSELEMNYQRIESISEFDKKKVELEKGLAGIILLAERKEQVLPNAYLNRSYEELTEELEKLTMLQELKQQYGSHLEEAQTLMPDLQLSAQTDWQETSEILEHMRLLKRMIAANRTDLEIKQWLTNGIPDKSIDLYGAIIDKMALHHADFLQVTNLFANADKLNTSALVKLRQRLQQCRDEFETMDAWIDFRDCRAVCEENGLGDFLLEAEDKYIPEGALKDVFMKSFYYEWFEKICAGIQSVSEFRVRSQNAKIEKFRELDDRQLPADQMRIREKLIQNMPTYHTSGRAEDEMSVLVHEIGKKRNIMPLRKLFRTIPNLLLRLKPCLMMSPLSVSYFLEAETYKFDMVIFDEASQIFPQDAIGSIFRGAQVIIAGDSKQLPPTNFFAANTNIDGDYDVDDDEEGEIVYDSILEEASDKLPNRSLLWHYRSRYEELISFSNQEIYQNDLITFPSSKVQCADTGVEFIHVENGVYENRCNRMEALRIVKLVDEHIANHPDRSLGIIAFSESQQSVIEEEINKYRSRNPEREWFFDEDSEEPFFVKNLENVQGDERDTIIFSICYGRNADGRMYMRFGPLGHQGGERRLNVAITRAKKNIKLVSSILPEDIDLSKSKSEGIRMLRSYLIFAIQGNAALVRHKKKNSLYDEDVFSEQVGKFLEQRGCKVHMNVGSSDYTVDIAIEHPKQPGRFIAGIECDGSSYYMARTVHDRDHLRSAVMENMGWNMYRVWSTEWIRNPEAEQERLMAFIENSLLTYGQRNPQEKNTEKEEEMPAVEIIETQQKQQKVNTKNPYNLPRYIKGNCRYGRMGSRGNELQRTAAMITSVVSVEQPMHMDLLYKRLCDKIASGRVTQAVREMVDKAIRTCLPNQVKIEDDFISMKDCGEVQGRMSLLGEPDRTIDQISIPEIAAVMERILKGAIGVEKAVLISEAASVFGFERCGPKIKKRAGEAIDYLVKNKKVSLMDDKLQLLEG